MKAFTFLLLLSTPLLVDGQARVYPITSFLESKATFRANSTIDWQKHPTTQVLIIIDGEGYYQERGKEPVVIKKGYVVKCTKEIQHWHTSSKESSVTYLAIYGGTQPTTWTEKQTQDYPEAENINGLSLVNEAETGELRLAY